MSNNWTRKQKIGKNLTVSIGSRRGPGFSSSLESQGMRMTIQNRVHGTTVRITKKSGNFKNVTTNQQSMSKIKPYKPKTFKSWIASTKASPYRG